VHLLAENGTYVQSVTNESGQATFSKLGFAPSAVFIAHDHYVSSCSECPETEVMINLIQRENTGSLVAFRGWQSLKAVSGSVSFIHDSQGRLYLYTQNMSVDGGHREPISIEPGMPIRLVTADGARATLVIKAVHGASFLVDVTHEAAATLPQ